MGENIDGGLSLSLQLSRLYEVYAEEAFTYLLDYFGIQANTQEFRIFRVSTGRGIVALAYFLRRRLRALFRESRLDPSDANEFSRFARSFALIRDQCYFFRILRRIAQIFELTVHCLNEGHDHIETARGIVTLDENYKYFEAHGGLHRLEQTGEYMSRMCNILDVVIQRESPRQYVLESFTESVDNLQRPLNDAMLPIREGYLNLLKRDLLKKTGYVTNDPFSSKIFHYTVCPHSSKVLDVSDEFPKARGRPEQNVRREKKAIFNLFHSSMTIVFGQFERSYWTPCEDLTLASCFATFRHLTDVMSTQLDFSRLNVRSRTPQNAPQLAIENIPSIDIPSHDDECFIVSGDYIAWRRGQEIESDQPSRLRISQSDLRQPTAKGIFTKNLRSVMNTNIDQNNFFRLKSGNWVVYTRGCKFDDSTMKVFVSE